MAALRAEAAVLARTPDATRLVVEAEATADRNPVATALARRAGALFRGDADGVLGTAAAFGQVVYYTSLLALVDCHVDAYEQAKWFGDDMALKTDFRHADFGAVTARPLFI